MKRRDVLVGASAGGLALWGGRAARAQAATPSHYPAGYSSMIEASRNETSLMIYSTFSEKSWRPLVTLFNQKYPWITVQTLDINGREALERYLTERAANSATADLMFLNAPEIWHDLYTRGEMMDYKSPEAPHLPAWSMPYPGVYTISVDAEVFVWNKLALPPDLVPTGLRDLHEKAKANPDVFRGRIATYKADHAVFYGLMYQRLVEHHGPEAWDWLETLGPMSRVEASSASAVEKVTTGEYVLAYFVSQGSTWTATRDPNRGRVLDWRFAADGTPMGPRFGGISSATRHPNAAKLFLDNMVSRDGHVALAACARMPYREDVKREDLAGGEFTYTRRSRSSVRTTSSSSPTPPTSAPASTSS